MLNKLFSGVTLACAFGAALATMPHPALAQLSKVLQVGDPGPSASTYKSVHRPEAGGTGRAAFTARAKGATKLSGIFEAAASPGASVALRDEFGGPGNILWKRLSRRPAINAGGDVAWLARVSAPTFSRGVFSQLAGDETVAVTGQPIPSLPGFFIHEIERPDITDAGDVAFFASIDGAGFSEAIFRCTGGDRNCTSTGTGNLEVLVAIGDTYFDSVTVQTREICDLTEHVDASDWGVAFYALTAMDNGGPGCGFTRASVLRLQYGSVIEAVAKNGDDAQPNVGSRFHDNFDGPPAINNSGDVAFLAETLFGVQEQEVIYFCDAGACPATLPQAMVLQHDPNPGAGGGDLTRFKAVGMSDADDIAFQAVVQGGTTSGFAVYVARAPAGTLERVAGQGDFTPAPDTGGEFGEADRPSMSSDGHVAFRAKVRWIYGGRFGIWVYQ